MRFTSALRHPLSVLVLAIVAVAFAACASQAGRAKGRPEWVSEPGREFPNETYIAVVGVGDAQGIAKRRAVERVALVFQCDVHTITEIIDSYYETEDDTESTAEKRSQFERALRVSADQKLKDVTTPRIWLDERTGEHHALAVLDRDHATRIYLAELAEKDRDVKSYLESLGREDDKLVKLAYLNHALFLAAERDMLAEQLNIITAGRSPFTATVRSADLVRARVDLKQEIRMRVAIDDSKWPEFANEVRSAMQGFGFGLVPGEADYEVRGGVSTQRLDRGDPSIRWLAEIHIVELPSETEILTVSLDDRETHLTSFSEAERRGVARATKLIGKALRQQFEDHLDSMIGS